MCSAYKLNKQGDNIQPWHTPFPIWNQSVVPCPVLTAVSWLAYTFLRKQVSWSDVPISWGIFHSLLWSIAVKGFSVVNEAEVAVFLELSCFFNDPADVGNLISGSSAFSKFSLYIWFTYYWGLAWSILSISLLACEISALDRSLNIFWHCLSLGLKWKLTFSSPVATAEFSKFAGILSAALSQHQLTGFEVAQLEFHHLHRLCL